MSSQLIAAAPGTALVFIVMDQTKFTLKQRYECMDRITMSAIAGAVAGGTRLSVLVPFDLLKTRAQAQKEGKIKYN